MNKFAADTGARDAPVPCHDLEGQPGAQLEHSRIISRKHLTEVRRVEAALYRSKLCVIKRVVRIRTELKIRFVVAI